MLSSVLAVMLCGLLAAPEGTKTTIAVIDLTDNGAGAATARNLTDVITASLSDLGVFEVLSRADIQQMVQFEQDKQLLGCESDTSCLAELGGALGVALLVTGSVGNVAGTFILNLALTDARIGRVLAREQRKISNAGDLTAETEGAARYLVRELLAGQQGYLILKTSENGADVEVDGRVVGVTPLPRQTLAGGPHRVRVLKKGFVAWTRDIAIEKDQPLVVDAALVPSLDFIDEYDGRAKRWRSFSYISGGAGAAALGFGAYSYFVYNAKRASDFNDEVERASCSADALEPPSVDCQARFADERSSIRNLDIVSTISMGVGVASLGVALYLFTQGPEPGIYDQYKPSATVEVSAAVVPTRGGALAAAAWRF